jgi:hypothetical protein
VVDEDADVGQRLDRDLQAAGMIGAVPATKAWAPTRTTRE